QLIAVSAQRRVDRAHQRMKIFTAHIMELDALARGQAQAAITVAIAGVVESEPLLTRELAAGRILDPHHEDEIAVFLAALVADALLVDAEGLGDFLGLLADSLGLARAERLDLGSKGMPPAARHLDIEQSLAPMLEMFDL